MTFNRKEFSHEYFSFLLRFILTIPLIFAAFPSFSGEWIDLGYRSENPRDSPDANCELKFQGVIEDGDLVSAIHDGTIFEGIHRVCLDSPGGSLGEVVDFIEAMEAAEEGTELYQGLWFGTKVASGDRCESACAILFLFGRGFFSNSAHIDRILEDGAILGFHAPSIPKNIGAVDAQRVFEVAMRVTKILFKYNYNRTKVGDFQVISDHILSIIYNTPPEKMYYVGPKIEKYLLEINPGQDPFDFRNERFGSRANSTKGGGFFTNLNDLYSLGFDQKSIQHGTIDICTTNLRLKYINYWMEGVYDIQKINGKRTHEYSQDSLSSVEYEFFENNDLPQEYWKSIIVAQDLNLIEYMFPGSISYSAGQNCRVEFVVEIIAGNRFFFNKVRVSFGKEGGNSSFPSYYRNNRARDLNVDAEISQMWADVIGYIDIENSLEIEPYGFQTAEDLPPFNFVLNNISRTLEPPVEIVNVLSCKLESEGARIANVDQFVNARQSPGLKAPIAKIFQKGERVTISPNSLIVVATEEDTNRCRAACTALSNNANDSQAQRIVNSCVNDHLFWYQVRSSTGSGYVSRKFLDVAPD